LGEVIYEEKSKEAPSCRNVHMLKEPWHENSNPFPHEHEYPSQRLRVTYTATTIMPPVINLGWNFGVERGKEG